MKSIAIVTSTRAEYGLLKPLIKRISEDKEMDLQLIVTGGHLYEKQGNTVDEIICDGYPIKKEIPILDEDDSTYGISISMANALMRFAEYFRDEKPDLLVILGDRTEMLGIAVAAMNERIPIAHIHGGEVTEGAIDDCVRHAITKMSYLHFTACEEYRHRVIQMGEAPNRVFNVGSLGVENILTQSLLTEESIRNNIGIPPGQKYAIVTFHPVTLESNTSEMQVHELCNAISVKNEYYYVITGANADAGGARINQILRDFAKENNNVMFVQNLGMIRYLSAMKYASFVLGNSSSGILEAPVFGTPTINIGDRQKGRIMAETVINCGSDKNQIIQAMLKVETVSHQKSYLFGNGSASHNIVSVIKQFMKNNNINLKKGFYDILT